MLCLLLEVIGSLFIGIEKEEWEDTIKKLKRIKDKDVQDKLKISYDALDYDQKQIFLDIACIFIGVDKRIAFHMRNYPKREIGVLRRRSLVKIGDNNELRMHDQLRDLGRDIVRQENVEKLGMRSRVWFHEEAIDVLERHTGTTEVKAICLNLKSESQVEDTESESEVEDFELESQVEAVCLTNEEFANLSNLRFLQMDLTKLDGDFKGLLLNLRWLCWKGCPEIFSPTNFHLKNLVILDLSESKVTEDWEGWNYIKIATKLKVLNLTGCKNMVRTPDFSSYATLERLILQDCWNLVDIDPSIGHLKSLVFLNLKNCAELNRLPLEFDKVEALTELLIDGTCIEEVPIGRGVMKKLETLSATYCQSLTQISTSIGSLVKLRRLSLRGCKLKELPDSIGKLESLIELDLSSTAITELPDTIGNLNRLRILKMESGLIVKLRSTIGMLLKLKELHASVCSLRGEIPNNFGGLSSLRILRLDSTRICGLPSICGFLTSKPLI
ncbi:disease resistance protein RUN1-like [Cornus florida]|uniref:disease resistance protein RUN1-like n=1 Tax=Cornus florida TaxID=4283 RepID=UPI00289D93E7|nr:disease resistance protein RUN1-like [Cornus florida]